MKAETITRVRTSLVPRAAGVLLLGSCLAACSFGDHAGAEKPQPTASASPSPNTLPPQATTHCKKLQKDKWLPVPQNLDIPGIAADLGVDPYDVSTGSYGAVVCEESLTLDDIVDHTPAAHLRVKGVGGDCLAVGLAIQNLPQPTSKYHRLLAVCAGTGESPSVGA